MLTYSNPRKHAEIDNWPSGRHRVTALFDIEINARGERATRTTSKPTGGFNNPKKRTYAEQAVIVDGSDGKTYIAELSGYGFVTIIQSNLQYQEEVIHPDNERFQGVLDLFK